MPSEKIKELIDEIRIETKTFRLFAPTNLAKEKNKFFKNKNYNPVFSYPPNGLDKFKNSLNKISKVKIPKTDNFESYYWRRILKETKLKLKLLLSMGDPDKITRISQKLYQCKFSTNYIDKAKKDAQIKAPFVPQETLDAKETKKEIKKYLDKLGITNWKVKIQTNADFYIQIRYKKELITISEEINWDFSSLDSTLAHEIDGHVIRAINALNQEIPIFQNPFPFYIKTEEGLASYLGDFCADGGNLARKHHAIKYLGGFLALNNSFREVYEFFIDNGFSSDLAFQRAFRLKRGFTDTSSAGCFAREAIYYEGMCEVEKYLNKNGGLKKLFAAKIGLEDIGYIKPADNLIIPERLGKLYNSKTIS